MALDTQDKRASTINATMPWRAESLFVADATVSKYDRRQALFQLRVIPTTPPPLPPGGEDAMPVVGVD